MSRRSWWLGAAAVAVLGYWLAPDRRLNVVLITVDSLRPDHLSMFGSRNTATPHIDQLGLRGVSFRTAVCDVPWTTASMASTLTGRYAVHHGLVLPHQRLRDEETTLAEVLAAQGYQTAAVVGSFPLDHIFNLAQGFAAYDDRYDDAMVTLNLQRPRMPSVYYGDADADRTFRAHKLEADSCRADESTADAAIGWLRRASRMRPFFLWVHFFGPHERRRAAEPAGVALDRMVSEYDGAVEGVDAAVGRVLDAIDADGLGGRRTLIVFHADHGQALLEHAFFGHGGNLYEPSLRVPLLVSLPGRLPMDVQVKTMARTIDIMPTILDVLGVAAPAGIDGRSLLPVIAGTEAGPTEAYCETLLSASAFMAQMVSAPDAGTIQLGFRRRGLRTPRWKYVLSEPHRLIDLTRPPPLAPEVAALYTSEELYDLAADPQEGRNVLADQPAVADELRRRVRAIAASATSAE